ncbi:MAG TPA: MerR family transcriptional regulator [Bryobacteraceae bacterium]|nr:MerR family transcriptional regulator [Bryobacteraceae bacterium]
MFAIGAAGSPAVEPVYSSSEVSRLAGITLRQLQWWDERKIVSPRKQGHRRLYTLPQVLEILTAGQLRHKGLSLQRVRRIVRLLRRPLEQIGSVPGHRSGQPRDYFVLTDGQSVQVEHQADGLIHAMAAARKPMYLVSLGDTIQRLAAGVPADRNRQLNLF